MRGGMVALVSTDVTSPQSMVASAGPTSMGESRSRTLRRLPSTQATSPSLRVSRRCRSSARCAAACRVRVLRLERSGSASDPPSSGRNERCAAAPAQRVDDPPGELGAAAEQLGQLAVVHRRPGLVVQDARPDPVGEQRASWSPTDGQRLQQVGVALLHQGAGRVTRERNRPGVTSTPRLAVMTSSSSWASSKTTTSCSGSTAPPLARCAP